MNMQDRVAAAELHADQVYRQHLAPLAGAASLEKMAGILNEKAVPVVRGPAGWNVMRVHRLLRIAQRGWRRHNG